MSKVIVITGASSGIGEATAKTLAKAGNKVVLAARRKDRLESLVADIQVAGGEAIYVLADVSKLEENKKIAQTALDTYGRIDVWVNNAGLMLLSEFSKGLVEEWDRMIDVNLKGTLYGIDAALPTMREQKSGAICQCGISIGPPSRSNNRGLCRNQIWGLGCQRISSPRRSHRPVQCPCDGHLARSSRYRTVTTCV